MIEFIRSIPADEFIGHKEWWKIGDHCEALIGFGKKLRSISIRDRDGNDITPIIAKQLDIKLVNEQSDTPEVRLNRTIDAFFIECQTETLASLLKQIDYICQTKLAK